MNEQPITIYVDHQRVKSSFYESNGYMMISALFFKHTSVLVDYSRGQHAIRLEQRKTTLTFYIDKYEVLIQEDNKIQQETLGVTPFEHNGKIYLPFQYVTEKLGMSIECSTSDSIHLVTNFSNESNENVFYNGPINKKKAALTFDDGPEDIYTPKILDILKEKGVQATFFVLGERVRWHPEIFKRIVYEGHEIGNHSWCHPNFIDLTTSELKKEIESTETEIGLHLGKKISILRPPYGLFTKSDIQIINELGYKVIMWSVETRDHTGLSDKEILTNVKRELKEGAIILLHNFKSLKGVLDGTVKALPVIIDMLKNEGFEIVTISELLE